MENKNDNIIYIEVSDADLDPYIRLWTYDDFGNRIHKETGKPVILVDSTNNGKDIK